MDTRHRHSPAKVAFHVGLAAGVVPFLSAPALWLAALWNRGQLPDEDRNAQEREQRRWTKRLFALAAVETVVAVVLGVAAATGIADEAMRDTSPPRIGVLLEETESGLRVVDVVEGAPAAEAGIAAGARIRAVNGERVRTRDALAARLEAGAEAQLEVVREGEARTVPVTPRTDVPPPTVVPTEPERCDELPSPRGMDDPFRLVPYGVFLLAAVGLWVVGRRRGAPQAVVWLPMFGVFLLASLLGSLGAWIGCLVAGAGLRGQSVGLALGELALTVLAVGWWALARRRRHVVPVEPPEPQTPMVRAYGLGLYYAATWMIRVALLSAPLVWLSREAGVGQTSPVLGELLGGGARDPVQAAMVFVAAVVLAPVAEETLFRGVVFPHLARSLSPWAAIVWSSVLFGMLHVAHGVLLVGPLTLGLVLGWARWRSDGLGAPILLHTTFNGAATVLSWTGG